MRLDADRFVNEYWATLSINSGKNSCDFNLVDLIPTHSPVMRYDPVMRYEVVQDCSQNPHVSQNVPYSTSKSMPGFENNENGYHEVFVSRFTALGQILPVEFARLCGREMFC